MVGTNQDVDKLYSILNIHNDEKMPRNSFNHGSMNRKLNSDASAFLGHKTNSTWSSSTKDFKM